jgi:hypothetical protein
MVTPEKQAEFNETQKGNNLNVPKQQANQKLMQG